jgi:hypothetical protein
MWKRNKLERYLGTWGWYKFFPEADELIHPEEVATFHAVVTHAARSHGYFCSVFACVETDAKFLRLRWKNFEIRALPDRYTIVPSPQLYWGDIVRIKRKPERYRRVEEIWIHLKRNQIIYHIESSDPYGTSYWYYDELEVVKDSE